MKIPIFIECVIQRATKCFKYILINGFENPSIIMNDQSPQEITISWWETIKIKRFEWDCMSVAIYYGEMEIIKILEENGIEKGSLSAHFEAAILSYRNGIAKEIINQMKGKNENEKINDEILKRSLISSAKNNNIKGAELFINNGADINAITNQKRMQTVLHFSLENYSKEIGKLLIIKGANINSEDIISHIVIIKVKIKEKYNT